MKKSGIFVASIAAAATISSSSKVQISTHQDDNLKKKEKKEENSSRKKLGETPKTSDKFAPKFDGLRFIETLVTAHR